MEECSRQNLEVTSGSEEVGSGEEQLPDLSLDGLSVDLSPAEKQRFELALEFENGSKRVPFEFGGPVHKAIV